jgi:hypothetical protein
VPLPSQSPVVGLSSTAPKEKVISGAPLLLELRSPRMVPSLKPGVSSPSPSQSPASAIVPGPFVKVRLMSAAPVVSAFRRAQTPLAGSNVPIVSSPSPSQSPATAAEVAEPNVRVTSAAPPLFVLRSSHVWVAGR